MKNKQILKEAIKKAVKNGWKWGETILDDLFGKNGRYSAYVSYPFIFNHDFAKAFWGSKEKFLNCKEHKIQYSSAVIGKYKYCPMCGKELEVVEKVANRGCEYELWRESLKEMVLEKDPVKYLEKFLK